MHVGLAGLLDATPLMDEAGRLRLAELSNAVDARWARVSQLRRRIRWTGFAQGHPAVVDDQEFTIDRTPLLVMLNRVSGTGYHEPSAQDARRRIVAFFDKHLRS